VERRVVGTSNNLALRSFSSQKMRAAAKRNSIAPCPTSPNMTPNKNGKVTTENTAIQVDG